MARRITPSFLYGQGLGVPIIPDEKTRNMIVVSGHEKVKQSILIILDTEPGERIMRSSFGCGLRRYLMHPNSASTRALIKRDVMNALRLWEPRIEVVTVTVNPGNDPSLIYIEISYKHLRDGREDNLVYPLYLE